MFSEISVRIKDEEKNLTKKFPHYGAFQMSEDDPVVKQCVEETLQNFAGTPDSIKFTATLEIK